jgi:hypothetical protein
MFRLFQKVVWCCFGYSPAIPATSKVKSTLLVGVAAVKFKRLIFEDPVTLRSAGRRWGVKLDSKMYDARSLRDLVGHGYHKVPHSRRDLTAFERDTIMDTLERNNYVGDMRHKDVVLLVFSFPDYGMIRMIIHLGANVEDMLDLLNSLDLCPLPGTRISFYIDRVPVFTELTQRMCDYFTGYRVEYIEAHC